MTEQKPTLLSAPTVTGGSGAHPVQTSTRTAMAVLLLALVAGVGLTSNAIASESQHDRNTVMPTPNNSHQTPQWRQWIADMVERTLAGFDKVADTTWRRLGDRLGFGEARYIAAYRGYANKEHVWVRGRLLGNRPYGGPRDDDTWWDNVKATYQRWESDEIPNAPVLLYYAGQVIEIDTDDEGYYSATFARSREHPDTDVVKATHRTRKGTLTATHWVMVPDQNATHMVISDVDDTVIHTGITDLKTAAELTFLNNAKTRKPLTGVAGLYRELATPGGATARNPIFYVSNSAWNMYDLLRDFLDLNELPRGPLLLRDLDLADMIAGEENFHKRDRIEELLQRVPLPAVLIGDSGQHDASLYADIASRYPQRIIAIYIRDVDPDIETQHDVKVARLIDRQHLDEIPFQLVRNSSAIASDLARTGVLPRSALRSVAAEVDSDERRETAPEKASKEILTPGG